MSLANVLRKLKAEAKTKASDHGHTLGRFEQPYSSDPTLIFAECTSCHRMVKIQAAIERGTHDLSGDVLAVRCSRRI